jgi:hypothetical protein
LALLAARPNDPRLVAIGGRPYTQPVMERFVALFSKHRPRLARFLLVGFVLVVSSQLWPSWPRETDVAFALGHDHADVVELRISYVRGDEELHGVSFTFPKGAPGVVHHKVTLPAGDFELRCALRERAGGSRLLIRRLHAPATSVRIELDPDSHAQNSPQSGSRQALLSKIRSDA